jgi:hypothetical protein
MKTMIAILSITLVGASVFAASKANKSETYILNCGTKADVSDYAKSKGEIVTPEYMSEVITNRQVTINILNNGNNGVTNVINSNEYGGLAVAVSCLQMSSIKAEIKSMGCHDLKTDLPVQYDIGFKSCTEFLDMNGYKF